MTVRAYFSAESESDVKGLAEEILEDLRPRMERAVVEGAGIFAERTRQLLGRPVEREAAEVAFAKRSGDVVRLRGSRRMGAEDGAPPRRDTGELQGSITTKPPRWTKRSVRVEWGSPLPQAGRLEWGGRDRTGRYIPPHPYMRPAEEAARDEVDRRLEEI